MRHTRSLLAIAVLGLTVGGCQSSHRQPLGEEITVQVTSSDESRPVRFTVDVLGGPAELRAPDGRLYATDAALRSHTPANLTLRPGTIGLSFQAIGGGTLNVTIVAPTARLAANGDNVQFSSTSGGLVIRTK